jgi:hypothetical protein
VNAKDLALGRGQVKALPGRKGDRGPKGDPGTDGLPGPPGPNGEAVRWRGKWTTGTYYQPLDAVEFEGSSYICTDVTSNQPPGYGWDLMAQRGKDGTGGNQQVVKGFGAVVVGGGAAIAASNTTYTSGTVVFSGNGNVTVATNGQTILISAAAGAGGLGAIANSETTYTSGTVAFSGLGNVTVRSTTGNAFQISVPAQSVQVETQTFLSGVGNSQTTYTSGVVNLSVVAGNLTIRSTTGQAFQFSMSQTVQAETQTFIGGIQNSETTYTSGTVNLSVVGGALTIRSTTGNAFQFSASQSAQTFVGGIAANALTTYTSGTVVISATGALQLSTNAQTISLGVPNFAMSTFGNLRIPTLTSTNATASTRSLFVFPFHPYDAVFPADITASTMRILMSVSYTTTATNVAALTMSAGLAIYRISGSASASTLSLLNSASWSFGSANTMASTAVSNSISGIRWATIHSSQWSSSPVFTEGGQYIGAWFSSTGGPALGSWAIYGASHSTMNIAGAIGQASVSNTTAGLPHYGGVYSATTAAFPASIHLNQLNRQVAMAAFVPLIEIDQWESTH